MENRRIHLLSELAGVYAKLRLPLCGADESSGHCCSLDRRPRSGRQEEKPLPAFEFIALNHIGSRPESGGRAVPEIFSALMSAPPSIKPHEGCAVDFMAMPTGVQTWIKSLSLNERDILHCSATPSACPPTS